MSWFSVKADNVSYADVVVANQGLDSVLDALPVTAFSSLSWWVYFLSFAFLVLFGYVLFSIARKYGLKLGNFWKVALVLSVVVSVYAAFFVLLLWDEPFGLIPGEMREGTFGDSFGTLNTLFSGLAFSGVLITLLIQRKDLADSRDQNARQQTESQFYNMLNLQQQVIQGFDLHKKLPDAQQTIQGRDCFREWGRQLRAKHLQLILKYKAVYSEERAMDAYQKVMRSHQGDLGLYFRSLYSIFRFIDNSDKAHKKDFALVVRSLLSDYELVFLFYNCLSLKGERFKRFAITHALFDNLDVELLLRPEHVLFMAKESYGENEAALLFFK